ncbi:MAG: hypothetical protein IPO21_20875 [Bacteroidales bacterium]|nr:hypothetical protein [Bacteroidales bacterium]
MWNKNTVIYQIFVDRFNGFSNINDTNPDFMGGNLDGIISKLDYLVQLGINCIWLTPIFNTTSYHGYHVTNYEAIDSQFGSIESLQHLIKIAHEKNIKILLDFVPNHCSIYHPFFVDAIQNKNSKYINWFHFTDWPNKYLSFLSYKEIPKLNLENQETAEYIITVAKKWLKLGIDGYRIDHAIGISKDFWRNFYKIIKADFPNCLLIAEIWVDGIEKKDFETIKLPSPDVLTKKGISQKKIQKAYRNCFDGIIDFYFQKNLINQLLNKTIDEAFIKKTHEYLDSYTHNCSPILFLDNHDMNRISYTLKTTNKKLKQHFHLYYHYPFR